MTNTVSDENRPARRTRRARAATTLALAALGAGLLGACGQASASGGVTMSCSGDDCRATVSSAPATVQETEVEQKKVKSGSGTKSKTTTKTQRSTETQFRVLAIAPGSVQVEGDDGAVTVPTGGTFVGDDDVVHVESSDGRTAVFTWRD